MIRDQDDSRAKAEAAYKRADRAYTKAVETYGGFDDRTVAAYRRRQKAEQALHAILRRNPPSTRAQISSLNRRIAAAERAGMPVAYLMEQRDLLLLKRGKRNPKGKYVFSGHDFTEETYPKTLFPWEVAYTKTLAGMPKSGIPDMLVDDSLAFIDERSARQWAESPRVLKAGYRPYAIRRRNPGLTPAGKKHLIQTMHKAGADTFKKKVAYVRRHIPNISDPQAFVGYVMAGERKGKRR